MMSNVLQCYPGNKYFVILVNYTHAELTVDCIRSLNEAGCNNEKIIVVDNLSPDNSLEILRKISGIKLIESEINGGFSYGNNLAIKWAIQQGCTGVILLNNDTVVDKCFFEDIFNGSEDEVCVPKIYYYSQPDMIFTAGTAFNYQKGRADMIGVNQKDAPEFSVDKYTDCACGCCMKIPRVVIDKVGLLDESYFMYREDDDYSLRLKEAGVRIHYIAEAKIWHKVAQSSGFESKSATYYGSRNNYFVMKKYHFPVTAWIWTIARNGIKYIRSFFDDSNNRILLRAWKDYRKGIMGKVDLP